MSSLQLSKLSNFSYIVKLNNYITLFNKIIRTIKIVVTKYVFYFLKFEVKIYFLTTLLLSLFTKSKSLNYIKIITCKKAFL